MNGKRSQLAYWIMGALLAGNLLMAGFAWKAMDDRVGRIEDKTDQIQAQYGTISALHATVESRGKQLDRMEARLDQLYQELSK